MDVLILAALWMLLILGSIAIYDYRSRHKKQDTHG